MTIEQAIAVAMADDCIPDQWKEAEKALVKAGLCPHCACDGERVKLGRYEPATHETYGGRECPCCEEFVVCGPQARRGEYLREDEPDTDASGACYSDAVSGF